MIEITLYYLNSCKFPHINAKVLVTKVLNVRKLGSKAAEQNSHNFSVLRGYKKVTLEMGLNSRYQRLKPSLIDVNLSCLKISTV